MRRSAICGSRSACIACSRDPRPMNSPFRRNVRRSEPLRLSLWYARVRVQRSPRRSAAPLARLGDLVYRAPALCRSGATSGSGTAADAGELPVDIQTDRALDRAACGKISHQLAHGFLLSSQRQHDRFRGQIVTRVDGRAAGACGGDRASAEADDRAARYRSGRRTTSHRARPRRKAGADRRCDLFHQSDDRVGGRFRDGRVRGGRRRAR